GSTLCGFATNMVSLASCRALQGLGAGSILPLAFTIVADIYPARERAGAQAVISMVWGMAAVAAPLLGLLARHERRAAEPMVPLHLWRNRTILVVNLASLPIGAMMMGVSAFLPPYVQGVMGRSTLIAGVSLAAMSIGWSAASPLAARLMHRTSYRANSIAGGLGMVAGALLLLLMRPDSGAPSAAAGAGLMGIGL